MAIPPLHHCLFDMRQFIFPAQLWYAAVIALGLATACSSAASSPGQAYFTSQSTDAEIAAFQASLAEAGIDVALNELVRHPAGHIERITMTLVCAPQHTTQLKADSLTVGDTIFFRQLDGQGKNAPCETEIRRASP